MVAWYACPFGFIQGAQKFCLLSRIGWKLPHIRLRWCIDHRVEYSFTVSCLYIKWSSVVDSWFSCYTEVWFHRIDCLWWARHHMGLCSRWCDQAISSRKETLSMSTLWCLATKNLYRYGRSANYVLHSTGWNIPGFEQNIQLQSPNTTSTPTPTNHRGEWNRIERSRW